jgi:aminopeptidase N
LLTVAALVAIGTGCGSQEASDPVATPLIDSRAPDRSLSTEGKAHVEYSDGRVTLRSEGSLRLAVLEQLAAQAGFEIIAGKIDAQPITLQIERAALVDAIALILDGISYTLEYDFDEASETRVIARVKIGDALAHDAVNPSETAATDALRKRDSAPSAAERARISRAGSASEANTAEQSELLSELDSSDPEARADAADWIDLEGDALARMIALLKSDPDAEVRATIVDRLGEEISPLTVAALIAAFQDPDTEVVLRAIEALEFDAEPDLIPELKPLLGHSDPDVREAAQDLIEDLKDL